MAVGGLGYPYRTSSLIYICLRIYVVVYLMHRSINIGWECLLFLSGKSAIRVLAGA